MLTPMASYIGGSFNEARALCAGSCGPGGRARSRTLGFNEARALCAGSSPQRQQAKQPVRGFNEARALCAGSCKVFFLDYSAAGASMRPAHCAREVWPSPPPNSARRSLQ